MHKFWNFTLSNVLCHLNLQLVTNLSSESIAYKSVMKTVTTELVTTRLGNVYAFIWFFFLYFNIVHINIKFTALRQSDNLKICCIFLSFFLTDDALDQLFGRCIYVLNLVFFSIKITHEYTLCQCRILLQNFSFVGGSIAVIVMSFLVGIVIYR